jgi:hypothetical protein
MSEGARKAATELFVVERESGEWLDVQGDGGYSVFTSLSEAQDALDSEADNCEEESSVYKIVRFVAIQPEREGGGNANLRVSMESNGSEGAIVPSADSGSAEQLSGGVSERRSQSGDESKCTEESCTVAYHRAAQSADPSLTVSAEQWDADLQEYRNAPSGKGRLAATWEDKPHRLVYDLCEIVVALRAKLVAQSANPVPIVSAEPVEMYDANILRAQASVITELRSKLAAAQSATGTISREDAARVCVDMAERYDADIEGCDGEELSRYSEAITCSFRLAYILKYDKFPPEGDDVWSAEFIQMFNDIRREACGGLTKEKS